MEGLEKWEVLHATLICPTPRRSDRGVPLGELTLRQHLLGDLLRRLTLADVLAERAIAPGGGGHVEIADARRCERGHHLPAARDDELRHLDDRLLKARGARVEAVGADVTIEEAQARRIRV